MRKHTSPVVFEAEALYCQKSLKSFDNLAGQQQKARRTDLHLISCKAAGFICITAAVVLHLLMLLPFCAL